MPETVPVTGVPSEPLAVTVWPRKLIAWSRSWDPSELCRLDWICCIVCSVENCASWLMNWVSSIGCIGSWFWSWATRSCRNDCSPNWLLFPATDARLGSVEPLVHGPDNVGTDMDVLLE